MSTLAPGGNSLAYLQQIQSKDPAIYQAIKFLLDQVNRLTRGGLVGTLSPDQKPARLTIADAGTQFFSTDYARGYRWTGTTWEDLPDSPQRFGVLAFAASPEPPIGLAPCDGRTISRSTSSGGITAYTTPILPFNTGLQYWVRL